MKKAERKRISPLVLSLIFVMATVFGVLPWVPVANATVSVKLHEGGCFLNTSANSCTHTTNGTIPVGYLVVAVLNLVSAGGGPIGNAFVNATGFNLPLVRSSNDINLGGGNWLRSAIFAGIAPAGGSWNFKGIFYPIIYAGSIGMTIMAFNGGLSATASCTAQGGAASWPNTTMRTFTPCTIPSGGEGIMGGQNGNTWAPTGGFTGYNPGAGGNFQGMGYNTSSLVGGVRFPNTGSYYFSEAAATFPKSSPGGNPPNVLTGKITGLDCGNCMIPGRPYTFVANASANKVPGPLKPITKIAFEFNEGTQLVLPALFTFVVANSTNGNGFTTSFAFGANYADIGSPVVHAKKIQGVWEWNVSIGVILRPTVADGMAGLVVAVYVNDSANGFTLATVQSGIQVLSQGGILSQKLSAANSSLIAGGGSFGCKVGYKGSCAINSTWIGLQQYSTQFAVSMNDRKICDETNGLPSCTEFWQNQPNANCSGGTCGEIYTNPGDWKITIHWFAFDPKAGKWVDVQHVVIQLYDGNEGDADQWTTVMTSWFVGNQFVKNQTLTLWIEQGPANQGNKGTIVGQVRFYVDMWLSRNNGSTIHGGRVGAYWTGMHNAGFLFWSSWSPTFENQTQAISYSTNPNLVSAQSYLCSKIGWQITRQPVGTYPTIALGSRNPKNYTIFVQNFEVEKFGITSNIARDGGVGTPQFVPAQVPNLPNTGLLAPLFALFATIGSLVWGAISGGLAAIWAAIGSQFPWFTGFWSAVYSGIASFFGLLLNIFPLLVGFVNWLGGLFSYVLTPIGIITSAFGGLAPLVSWIPIAQLPILLTLVLIAMFAYRYLFALERGDFGLLVSDARRGWGIVNAVMFWAYKFIRAVIDSIVGLIP